MKVLLSSILALGLALAGCMDSVEGGGEGDVQLDRTEQALSSATEFFNYSCGPGSTQCTKSFTPTAGRNFCFLMSINGNLANNGGITLSRGFAGVWTAAVSGPQSNYIGGKIACVVATGSVSEVSWYSQQGQAQSIFHGTPTTRCFLSKVVNYDTNLAFGVWNESFRIIPGPGANDHQITGVFPEHSRVDVNMMCGDIPNVVAGVAYANGTYNAVGGTMSGNTGYVTCGLNGIGGQFQWSSLTDGVGFTLTSNLPSGTWLWNASQWKGIWGECDR